MQYKDFMTTCNFSILKSAIVEIASETRLKYFKSNNSPIQNLLSIANELGFSIIRADENDCSCLLEIKQNGNRIIWIRNNSTALQENFMIARALGHYFLHASQGEEKGIAFTRSESSRQRIEATWFAVELMLPEHEFTAEAHALDFDLYKLADRFHVERSLVSARLGSLFCHL